MNLNKIEEIFSGYYEMLGYLVDDLAHFGKINEAIGINKWHNLEFEINNKTKQLLKDKTYST